MTTMQESIVVIAAIVATVVSVGVLLLAAKAIKTRLSIPAHVKSNIRKEKRLLKSIISDIKKNPSHWIALPYDLMSQKEPHLINDKKNMAVMLSGMGESLVIKMNLIAAHKYRESAEETIATTIKGPHAKRFIKHAEGLIDTRGKELSFIEDMLSRRL